tara:strand:+ start:2591 stop:3094 length:504 start_codon:yes stop_codon:yes gene_type:complete
MNHEPMDGGRSESLLNTSLRDDPPSLRDGRPPQSPVMTKEQWDELMAECNATKEEAIENLSQFFGVMGVPTERDILNECQRIDKEKEGYIINPAYSPLNTQEGGDHYKSMKIQPIEFIHANQLPFIEGCVIKYICRHHRKNGIEDLEKAKHFIDLLIDLEYNKTGTE